MCAVKILAKQAADESNALFNYVGLPLAMAGGGALLGAGLGAAHHPISEAFETDKSPESRLQRLKQKLVSGSIGGAGAGLGVLLSRTINRYLDKDAASRCWKGYEPVPGKTPYSEDSCKPIGSKAKQKEKKAAGCGCGGQKCDNCGTSPCECNSGADPSRAVKIAAARLIIKAAGTRGLWDNVHAKRKRGERPAKPGEKDYPDSKSWNATVKAGAVDKLISMLATGHLKQAEGAWTRSEGKSESGGLNAKGRASLKAQGHDIKPPVTEDNPTGERAGRRASFCARMSGMKRKRTSAETARDPDSRINKSLRKWKC